MKGLGSRIKALRVAHRMTLVAVAQKTGIDQATLSRIENEKMLGTLRSHLKIAEALGVRLTDLYTEVLANNDAAKGVPAEQPAETFFHSGGAVAQLLTSSIFNKKMMPVLLRLKPKGRTEVEEYSAASERFLYVLKGRLELSLDRQIRKLGKGQSAYFNADRPHFFKNITGDECVCLSVLTPVTP